jgi:hypothetical protein
MLNSGAQVCQIDNPIIFFYTFAARKIKPICSDQEAKENLEYIGDTNSGYSGLIASKRPILQ